MKKMKFSKPVWCCIIAIEIILLCVCYFAYRNRESVELNFTQDDLIYETGESGFYIDRSSSHLYTATPEFTLPKGFYTVEVEYERSNNYLATALEVQYVRKWYINQYYQKTFNNALSGRIIPIDPHKVSCDFFAKYDDRPMQVRGYLTEEWEETQYILIRNIRIVSSPVTAWNFLFHLVTIFIIVDLLLLLYSIMNRFQISNESKKHIKILVILIFISCIPLMTDYLFIDGASDIKFHLTRIEGLKEGLLNGMFPVKIQPGWLNGHGYATSVFYGDLFLYIPAVIRFFGVSLQASYKFYVLLVNAATALIAYHCFRGMSNARTGLVCTVVYTLNIYRLFDIYTRAAVGEYTAMIFTPLVLYGFWKAYILPEESKEHERSWITISIGCCGIFLSHMITTEMTAFFIIITVLILWKKTFHKKTFIVLCKAAAATILLSSWFLVPFLDYMLNESFSINTLGGYEIYTMEDRSIFPAQFFMIDQSAIAASRDLMDGAANERPYTVGMAGLSALAVWFYICLGRKETEISEKKTEYFAVFLCLLSLIMTTWYFPYTWVATKFSILENSIISLQFPLRFLSISGVVFVYLLCLILKKEWIAENRKNVYMGLLIVVSVFQGLSYMSKCLDEYSPYRAYQSGNLSTYDVIGGEYFPSDPNVPSSKEGYINELTLYSDSVVITDWHRDKGAVIVSLTNNGAETTQIDVPLLLYKGYHAIADSGEELAISPGPSFRISVFVPAGFDGNFRVEFKEPWYWRMGEVISLFALLCMFFYPYLRKYHQKK